jgi:hypothetical protein
MDSGSSVRGFKIKSDADLQRAVALNVACVYCENLCYCPCCGLRLCRLKYALRVAPCKRFKRNVDFHGHLPWELVK